MSDTLNMYFSSVFTIEDTVNMPTIERINDSTNDISNIMFHAQMVKKKLCNLKSFSAPGPDNLSPNLLINLADSLMYPLAIIFQLSFDKGEVPRDWRIAHVMPIYKKGSKSKVENYRPVSLTSVICKVMESIVKDKIVEHVTTSELIFPSQHGFMAKRSCLTNLLEYLEDVTNMVDRGHCVDVCYMDLSKAFDKVPHMRLLKVLEAHGIVGPALNWIRAWLNHREQRVVLNGEKSEWLPVTSGVPQGSVLGPTLFVLFINPLDIELGSDLDILSKFADDTKIGAIADTEENRQALQNNIERASDWADKWQMKFNAAKCHMIHFGGKNPCHSYTMGGYAPGGQILDSVNNEKDLGIFISSDLKPSLQCQKAAKKANSVLGCMARGLTYRTKDVWLKLYKVYVRPILEYSVQAWNPWLSKDIKVIEDVQKRAVRMTSGLKSNDYEGKLKEVGLTSLAKRRERGDLIQTWKIINKYDRVEEGRWFERVDTDREVTTRLSSCPLNLRLTNCNLDIRKYFFSQRVVTTWNSLPVKVKTATTLNSFKNSLDKFLSEH